MRSEGTTWAVRLMLMRRLVLVVCSVGSHSSLIASVAAKGRQGLWWALAWAAIAQATDGGQDPADTLRAAGTVNRAVGVPIAAVDGACIRWSVVSVCGGCGGCGVGRSGGTLHTAHAASNMALHIVQSAQLNSTTSCDIALALNSPPLYGRIGPPKVGSLR